MALSFNSSTLRGVFDSVSDPERACNVDIANGDIRIQQRGSGAGTRHRLRIRSGWARVHDHRVNKAQMLALAEALVDIADPKATQDQAG